MSERKASISLSVFAKTNAGRARTPGNILDAIKAERGQVPDSDLVIAAVRGWAFMMHNYELQYFCNRLDEMLDE